MSNLWPTIVTNFHDLMENSSTGVNSLTAVTNTYKELDASVDPRTTCIPGSITNGAYSVLIEKINFIRADLGLGILFFDYDVLLLLCYEFNISEAKTSYNAVYTDIEEIIRRRLNVNTWLRGQLPGIDAVTCQSISPMKFISEPDTEHFTYFELVFRVSGRTSIE